MFNLDKVDTIYLACGVTDLRKSIDGLAIIVQQQLKLDPFETALFVFCNKQMNKIKILHFDEGFWLYYYRIEHGRLKWPMTTEEALKTVPQTYREASLGLGATKFQTLYKVILPSAIPGILSGVILSIGRVIGESAAVFLTAGTVASMPSTIFDSARTLTVHSYLLTKELGDISGAASVGIVLIIIVLFLNTIAKFIAKKLNKGNI